jgi:hypothetical protein
MTSKNSQRTERVQIYFECEELAALDEFRFETRMPSRAAAARELLRRGLAAVKKMDEQASD